MNYSNYFQFYNEFLYQQHKSLLERVQQCEIEENREDLIKQNDQYDHKSEEKQENEKNIDLIKETSPKSKGKDEILKPPSNLEGGQDMSADAPLKIANTTKNKRNYSSSSESEINAENSKLKSLKNLRRKRTRRSISKKQSVEEYETINSSTSSANSESELISETMSSGSFEGNRDAKLKPKTKGNESASPIKVSEGNNFNQTEIVNTGIDGQLPENLKSSGEDGQCLSKPESKNLIDLENRSSKIEVKGHIENITPSYQNFIPNGPLLHNFNVFQGQSFEQYPLNQQYLNFYNQPSQWNYHQFYEAPYEAHKDFADKNESFNHIYSNHNHFYGNLNQIQQNFNQNYFNESHGTKFYANLTETRKNYTKKSSSHQEMAQAHHNPNQLFPYSSQLYLNYNEPFIQSLSIPIQSPSTSNNLKCENCPKIFKSIVRLENHIEKHHSRKLAYKCKYCRSSFKRKSKLLNHQHKSHSEKFSTSKKSSVFHNVELLAQSDCHWNE